MTSSQSPASLFGWLRLQQSAGGAQEHASHLRPASENPRLDTVRAEDLRRQFQALSSGDRSQIVRSDDLISRALAEMTSQERERVYSDIHGVQASIEETPELTKAALTDMQNKLMVLKMGSPSFLLAESTNYKFVHNRDKYLEFLRIEDFDVRAAAVRMIKYYEFKRDFFGESALCRQLTLEDLTNEEMKVNRKGRVQWMPVRDRANRPISVYFLDKEFCSKSIPRISWIQTVDDQETAKRGQVHIFFNTVEGFSVGMSDMFGWLRSKEAMPFKLACVHYVLLGDNHAQVFGAMEMYMGLLGKEMRAKVKIHRGSYQEIMYSLMTYGIPTDHIPLNENGVLKTKGHLEFVNVLAARDRLRLHGREPILVPLNTDILSGKGKPFQLHVGNQMMKHLVEEVLQEYNEVDKSGKTRIIQGVVQTLKQTKGCRFLSKDSGAWLEVGDDVATAKVSQLFRARREVSKNTKVEKRDRRGHSVLTQSDGKRARTGTPDNIE